MLQRKLQTHLSLLIGTVVVAGVATAALSRMNSAPVALLASCNREWLPADGDAAAEITVRASDGRVLSSSEVSIRVQDGGNKGIHVGSVEGEGRELRAAVSAGVLPGPVTLRITAQKLRTVVVRLEVVPSYSDRFADGTPDFLRLDDAADRDAFRRWFTLLADYESLLPAEKLSAEISDCAALIRFSYRGALHAHVAGWIAETGLESLPSVPSVQKYQYPLTPLGSNLLRVKSGAFTPEDLGNGAFAQFADVKNLQRYNTHFISRDIQQAQPGDILFFRQLEQNEPYHSMIFVGTSQFTPEASPLVIYHTGPIGKSGGEIRRVQLTDLLRHPSPRWRPVVGNSNFLGVYRWNILREAEY